MPYRFWSPFSSGENFRHQLSLIGRNVVTLTEWLWGMRWLSGPADPRKAARLLPGFDLLGASLAGVLSGLAVLLMNRARPRRVRWTWAVVPVLCLGGRYLPFWVQPEDQRYFYGTLPLVWVLVFGAWGWACRQGWQWTREIRMRVFRVVAVSFVIPATLWLAAGIYRIPNSASDAAVELAGWLKSAGQNGPLAGSASLAGGRTGLYTAFLLGQPWVGDDVNAGPADFEAVGARVVVLRRDSPQGEAFGRTSRWHKATGGGWLAPIDVFLFVLSGQE